MTDTEQKLLEWYRHCADSDRQLLLAFAEFLGSRNEIPAVVPTAAGIQPEQRPAQESVVLAIKRLMRVYPMLDRRKLMGPTSLLMSQHALQGRSAIEVINDLELVFERHYEESVQE